MKLETFIKILEALPQDKIVVDGLGNPHSWRGNYYELAFECVNNIKVSDMLQSAKECVGKVFCGHKGGDYLMTGDTKIHIASPGCLRDDSWRFPAFLSLDCNNGLHEVFQLMYINQMIEQSEFN